MEEKEKEEVVNNPTENEETKKEMEINVGKKEEEYHNKKDKKKIQHLEKKIATLEEENKNLNEEVAKLNDSLIRKQADFENYRKRSTEDRQKDRKYALQDFLEEAIEVLDVFDAAVNNETDDEKLKKYLSGFQMINNRLKNVLENNGVTLIDCLNKPFDPSLETALETVEQEGVEKGMVVEVVMRGYKYKDRVLRPAMVKVSK